MSNLPIERLMKFSRDVKDAKQGGPLPPVPGSALCEFDDCEKQAVWKWRHPRLMPEGGWSTVDTYYCDTHGRGMQHTHPELRMERLMPNDQALATPRITQ